MNKKLTQGVIIVAMAVGGLSVAGPAAAQRAQENFGSHVSDCAKMGGFSGEHNPSMHRISGHDDCSMEHSR